MTTRIAIIGGGIVGLAAAWSLEKRGFACLVFESGAPGGAQSGGESRIFRHAHDDPRQVELAIDARHGWRRWEAEFDVQLVSDDGSMAIGDRAIERLRGNGRAPEFPVRELDAGDVRKVLPILAGYDGPALLDVDAGAIRTRMALAGLINSVGLNLVPENVTAVTPREGGGVAVETGFGERMFDAAVVAAGPGTSRLASDAGIEIPSSVSAQVRLTLPLASSRAAGQLACIHDMSGRFGEAAAFGSPVRGNHEYAVGLATNVDVDPAAVDPGPLERLERRTRDYIERAFPGLDPSHPVPFQRWVTGLPWSRDALAIWQRGDCYYVVGQNLFKLAPALGEAVARSVAGGEVEPGFRPDDQRGRPPEMTRNHPSPGGGAHG